MTAKLSGQDLSLFRGEKCLFKRLDFALNPGELLLLEGANGSGKTSLLKAMLGLLELETGDVFWNGEPVRGQRQEFHGALVWMAHRVGFKGDLTLLENLEFERALRPQRGDDVVSVLERLGIERLRQLPMRSLSAGQQRRAALARMLIADVSLWMMDEPFTNLDRAGRALVLKLVREHLGRGGMCVMTAHQDVDIEFPIQRIELQ